MRKRQHAGPSTKVALDLGSTFVKMLAASDDGGRLKLAGFGMKRLAGHSAEDKVRAIRELAAESHIAVKDLAISVCGPAVQVRFISMPKMKEDELAGATKFEAEKFMPFNIDECVVDYHILRRNEHENKLDLILVAAKKDFVEGKISIVEEAGFSVRMVDVDSLAMTNAFLKNLPPSGNEKTVALMDMGSSASNLSILNGGNLCFVRAIAMAGNDFDEAISRGLGVDVASAQGLKTEPGTRAGEIAAIVKGAANTLIDEIRLSFGYYENLYGGAVDEIYLSGGSSALIGMGEALGEAFGTKPIAWDPVNFMDVSGVDAASLETAKRYLAVASGLALR